MNAPLQSARRCPVPERVEQGPGERRGRWRPQPPGTRHIHRTPRPCSASVGTCSCLGRRRGRADKGPSEASCGPSPRAWGEREAASRQRPSPAAPQPPVRARFPPTEASRLPGAGGGGRKAAGPRWGSGHGGARHAKGSTPQSHTLTGPSRADVVSHAFVTIRTTRTVARNQRRVPNPK